MTVNINLQLPESTQLALLSDGAQELNRINMDAGGSPEILISKDGELCTAAGDGELVDLTVDSLATMLRTVCVPGRAKTDDTGSVTFVELPCLPRPLVRAYMETRHWPGIPRIKQVARAPIVRPDFSIRWNSGWDETTNCWVTKGLKKDTYFLDNKVPSRDGTDMEWFDIRRVFDVFPFLDRRLVADALAAAFTPLLSTAIDSALPGLIISARRPASGKTELAKFCSILGNGGKTFTTWRGATELEKMIGTYVAEDNRVVIFDNIKNDIDSTAMESVITARAVSFRKLYSHKSISLRSNTSWFMTANGAVASQDMTRRSIVIMLDKENTPGTREWTGDIPAFVETNEARLVTLMCSMIEAWRDAGCIRGKAHFSNFEEWSGIVSGILEAAGIAGMFEARDEVVDEAIQTDDEDDIPILEAIGAVMGSEEFFAGELWEKVNDVMNMDFSSGKVQIVREWLKSVGKVKSGTKMPGIPTSRALRTLDGKTFPGCSVILRSRSLDGKKRYKCLNKDGTELPKPSHGNVDGRYGNM